MFFPLFFKTPEVYASTRIDNSGQTSTETAETQPTPPPRKKKLKKKLEQLIGKKLEETFAEECFAPPNETEDNQDCNVAEKDEQSNEEICSDPKLNTEISKVVTEDGAESPSLTALDDRKSPKRSRRRKKHMQ